MTISQYAVLYMTCPLGMEKIYAEHVNKHNDSVRTSQYPNAGFDILTPDNTSFFYQNAGVRMVDFGFKCEMRIHRDGVDVPTGFYLYPRSSISKTPLMLANHTGIIDSGYRGNIIGAFRVLDPNVTEYVVPATTRLLQICAPDLRPIQVVIVENSFFLETERGEGGFGSTGR
jgi:dUTPase